MVALKPLPYLVVYGTIASEVVAHGHHFSGFSPRSLPDCASLFDLKKVSGSEAVLGVWIGGFIFNNLLAAIFLALGAGAIAQVVYEVGRLITKQSAEDGTPVLSRATFGGLIAGILIMCATALLVTA